MIDRFDGELSIASVVGIKSIADFRTGRMDTSPVEAGGIALPYER